MSTVGRIKTLFSDKNNEEVLFPRTKVNAISDGEGTGLNVILDTVVHFGNLSEGEGSNPINADTLGGKAAEEYVTKVFIKNNIEKIVNEKVDKITENFVTKKEVQNNLTENFVSKEYAENFVVKEEIENFVTKEEANNHVIKSEDGMRDLFASGRMILSSNQYGDTLPEPGIAGRVFFKKISE